MKFLVRFIDDRTGRYVISAQRIEQDDRKSAENWGREYADSLGKDCNIVVEAEKVA